MIQPSAHLRRGGAAALAVVLVALGLAGCSDDDGATTDTTVSAAEIPDLADLPAPDGEAFCEAVEELGAAKERVTVLREAAEVDGTSSSVLGSQEFADAMALVATGSGRYLTAAPAEIVALAQEKEGLDDAVGAQVLAGEQLDEAGRASLDRAGRIATLLGEYSETHCGRVAVPS